MVLLGTHIPAFCDLTLRAPAVHAGEHALYLWAALIFWAPLIAVDPVAAPPVLDRSGAHMLTAMIPMTIVGVWLLTRRPRRLPALRRLRGGARRPARGRGGDVAGGGTGLMIAGTLIVVWLAMLREAPRAGAEAYQR